MTLNGGGVFSNIFLPFPPPTESTDWVWLSNTRRPGTVYDFWFLIFFFLLTHCFQNKLRHGLLKKAMIWKLKKSYTMPVIEVEITVRPLFLSEVVPPPAEEVNELSGTCSSTAADCCHCGWIWEEILVNLLDRKLLILGSIVLWICFTLLLIIILLSSSTV